MMKPIVAEESENERGSSFNDRGSREGEEGEEEEDDEDEYEIEEAKRESAMDERDAMKNAIKQ